MPKIVVYQPQADDSENEVDIAEEEPPVCEESCKDVIRCNKILHTSIKTPSPSRRIARSCSEIRKQPVKRKQQSQASTEVDVCRISMPCNRGCCYCTYANNLGPVKIKVSSYNQQKDRLLSSIKDGRGNKIIPTSRKDDIKGLVYDKETFSLHPPQESKPCNHFRRSRRR